MMHQSSRARPARFARLPVLALAAMPVFAGCIAGEQGLTNKEDYFEFTLEGAGAGFNHEWDWKTTGGDVAVGFSVEGASSGIRVSVTDPTGKERFARSMNGAGEQSEDEVIRVAPAGTWTVRVRADSLGGELALELDARKGRLSTGSHRIGS